MFAIVYDEPGGPEVLRWAEAPDPEPGPGEVLIDVAATAVNRADLLQREGHYPPPRGASPILGLECAGVIAAVADDVNDAADWQVGDQVCALLSGGGYAEKVRVPATQLLPVPTGVPLVDAAGLPEVVCTVWSNLVMTAGLRAGDTLLAHGGSSGIGTMAIQLGKLIGARVAVTASSDAKLDLCRTLGADILINYREEDFVARLADETDGHGADVILDGVGAKYVARNIAAVATGGRIVTIGLLGGRRAELDLGALMAKRAGIFGTTLRSRPRSGPGSKAEVVQAVRENVWPAIESGKIAPVVGARLPITDAGEAHRRIGAGESTGKIILTIPGESGR